MFFSQSEDHTLPHRCRNAALCITAKLIVEWQKWVKLSLVSFTPQSRHHEFATTCLLRATSGREHLQQKPGRGPFRLFTKLM